MAHHVINPVVPPVVGGLIGALASNAAATAFKLIGNSYNHWSSFDDDIRSLKRELLMIAGEEQCSGKDDLSTVMRISMEEMRDLAFEIEDLLDRIQRHSVERNGGLLHAVLGFTSKLELVDKVQELKKRLQDAYQRQSDHKVNGSQPSTSSTLPANTYWTNIKPVGIKESSEEILEWVMKDDVKGQPEQLSVISIVGFSGSGKSTLAKEVYNSDDVKKQFPHRPCVVASKHSGNTKELLTELFKKLNEGVKISDSEDIEQLQTKISSYLKNTNKRCLIVLDDIRDQTWWDDIEPAFPEKAKVRIIMTTRIQRVAIACSRGDGYVHNMAALGVFHSKKLMNGILKEKGKPSPGLDGSSPSIVKKCDGNPHALVAAAAYLQRNHVISETHCDQLSHMLGTLMATDNTLQRLQKVLMDSYTSLPKEKIPFLKTCLLYLCVFPNGCHIRGSRLMRRCLAEGYVQNDCALEVADELGDQSVVWAIDSRKNGKVKTCRAHGFFYEFLMHMSTSAKFITSLHNDKERRNCRHLFLHNKSSGGRSGDDKEELRAHSLTIHGSAGEGVGYFDKCQLLRVLDLEECNDLKDEHLDGIHKMWHLKYLSVGSTISKPPNNIEKLHCLETLDMRQTKQEIILPVEVLKMPNVAHLLGRFKLETKQNWENSKPEQYLPEQSNLQTLAGFVTDHNPMFQKLMYHMQRLRKVKIWLNSTDEDTSDIKDAIESFVQPDLDRGSSVRSLSLLDIGKSSRDILHSLTAGILRSLKLHGMLKGLVHFATVLEIKELCLSSTNDLANFDIPQLRKLKNLEYLKLVGVSLGDLVIECGDFIFLQRLCLVECRSLPAIKEGALPNLLSLRLLIKGLDGLSGININWHKSLREVALDSKVKPKTRKDWKDAAKKHPKRPNVLFFKRVDPEEPGSMVKYVATDSTTIGTETNDDAVQQDSSDSISAEVPNILRNWRQILWRVIVPRGN